MLGPLTSIAGKYLGPLVGNVTKAFGGTAGAAGQALTRSGAIEFGRAMKPILDLYNKYGGTLANVAAGTVKPGLETEAKIALGQIRVAVINMNRKLSPEVTKFLIAKLKSLRNATWELVIDEAPEVLGKQTVGKGWTLFIDTVLSVL